MTTQLLGYGSKNLPTWESFMPVICTGRVPKFKRGRDRQRKRGEGNCNHNYMYVIHMDIFYAIGWTLWSHKQNNHG